MSWRPRNGSTPDYRERDDNPSRFSSGRGGYQNHFNNHDSSRGGGGGSFRGGYQSGRGEQHFGGGGGGYYNRTQNERPAPSQRSGSSIDSADGDRRTSRREQQLEANYDDEYFLRISKRIQDGFNDDIDKEVFADNISKQVEGNETYLVQFKQPSICIQWLVENASDVTPIKHLCKAFSVQNITVDLVRNQYASHLFQALLEACLKIISKETSGRDSGANNASWAIEYVAGFGDFIVENMDQLIDDLNGNHVMITFIEALGGIRVGRHWSRKTMGFGMKSNINAAIEKDVVVRELPPSFKQLLKRVAKKLVVGKDEQQMLEVVMGKGTSVVQYLLFVLKIRSTDLCDKVIKRLVDAIFATRENTLAVTTSPLSAYLVEAVLLVSSEERLKKIWDRHLKTSLQDMWKHDIANFIVQRLVDAACTADMFNDVCNEILPDLEDIFRLNRPGLGVCLSKACQKFPESQNSFVTALMKSFHCFEPKECRVHIVSLMLFGDNSGNNQNSEVWLHGSLMLQYIFGFENPHKITKSLLSLEPLELVRICNDKSGSHVIDSFLQSEAIGIKHKQEFIDKLRGHFSKLACDRFGSRIIDHILNSFDHKLKEIVVEELSERESELHNSRNGFHVGKRAGLYHYKNRPDEWREVERERERKRHAFSGLLDNDARGPKRNRFGSE